MPSVLFFYLACFLISFLLCIPIGPVNLEVFHSAVRKEHAHALSTAFGASCGDAVWAMASFYGISPFLRNGQSNMLLEALFLLVAGVITFVLGIIALKDARLIDKIEKKEEELAGKIKRKRWAVLKGFAMVLVNPLGIGSWMIALSFLRKLKVYIPLRLTYEVFFFATVITGAFAYFLTIVFITHKMKKMFSPQRTIMIVRVLGYLLILFSLYFLFFSVKELILYHR